MRQRGCLHQLPGDAYDPTAKSPLLLGGTQFKRTWVSWGSSFCPLASLRDRDGNDCGRRVGMVTNPIAADGVSLYGTGNAT